MSSITIKQSGILDTECDAVVNAANTNLAQGGGVCGVIFKAAGSDELNAACKQIGHCDTGHAVITSGYKLCKYIIHAVGPVWYGGKYKEPQLLYNAYISTLELCRENNVASVAIPLISAGIFGYPLDRAWKKALEACNDFIVKYPEYSIDIVFTIPEDYKYNAGLDMADQLNIQLTNTKGKTYVVTLSEEEVDRAIKSLSNKEKYPIKNLLQQDDNFNGKVYRWFLNHYEKLDISSFTKDDCINYLHYIYLQDSFHEGYVDYCYENGTFLNVMLRLKELFELEK